MLANWWNNRITIIYPWTKVLSGWHAHFSTTHQIIKTVVVWKELFTVCHCEVRRYFFPSYTRTINIMRCEVMKVLIQPLYHSNHQCTFCQLLKADRSLRTALAYVKRRRTIPGYNPRHMQLPSEPVLELTQHITWTDLWKTLDTGYDSGWVGMGLQNRWPRTEASVKVPSEALCSPCCFLRAQESLNYVFSNCFSHLWQLIM
jgi:hypothetical protein